MLRILRSSLLALALAACSTSGAAADAGADVPVIPPSCGNTGDCVTMGLDADTCVYETDVTGCAGVGRCQLLTLSTDVASCTTQQAICPCSGSTQLIPPCWPEGLSPYAVLTLGECPVDAGDAN